MSKYLNRALLFIALGSMCSPVLSTENVAGDDLDFFHPERKSVQVSPLNIIDIRGKELSDPIVVKAAELDVAHELEQLESSPAKEIAQSMAPFAIANERKLVPEFVAMMEAHARNAGVNLEVLYASSLNPDLEIEVGIGVDFSEQLRLIKGCTTMAFPNGLVGQTLDWPVESINDNTSVLLSDQVIATMGGAAIYQQMGRNVGVTVNHMGGLSDPDPRDPQNVVSLGAMLYAMALSDSVDHAIKIAEKYTTPIAFNFTLADKGGSTALVEMLAGGGPR